jgi:transcriptional regulator with XRE-family HTH domain
VFAANLRAARKKAGLRQAALGRICGLHRTEVSLIERAGREPRLETIAKLASGLAVPIDALCEGIAWDAEAKRFRAKPD